MSDERLDRLLAELPRETAGPHFTARTLARLDLPPRRERPARAGLAPWVAVPAAASLALAALLVGGRERADRAEAQRLLTQIRAEHGRLATELANLREEREAPVVYLGGDEKIDLVVDLGRVRELPAGADPSPNPAVRRASGPGTID